MVTKKILLSALFAGGLFGAFQAQAMEGDPDVPAFDREYIKIRELRENIRKLEAELEKALKEKVDSSRIKELEELIWLYQEQWAKETFIRTTMILFDRLAAKAKRK